MKNNNDLKQSIERLRRNVAYVHETNEAEQDYLAAEIKKFQNAYRDIRSLLDRLRESQV
ncbi:MAG: hypothetical protein Q4P72_06625 [Eubacteriales bacterium]|nr:hypothetical protein [Eubacteriales bacterium]